MSQVKEKKNIVLIKKSIKNQGKERKEEKNLN